MDTKPDNVAKEKEALLRATTCMRFDNLTIGCFELFWY